MKKKKIGIFILIMLIGTAIPTVGIMNTNYDSKLFNNTKSTDIIWSDNFDTYSLGQYLDGTSDDGGWKSWADIPTGGAYVVNDQFRSPPHSVEISENSDIVHEFSYIRSGSWVFTDWVYVQSGYEQKTVIIFFSYYNHDTIEFFYPFSIYFLSDGENGIVYDEDSYNPLPLLLDQWVKIHVEIDLEANWYKCYYNDELLVENKWTLGGEAGLHNGFRNFAGIDIFNYESEFSARIYHDDMSIEGETTGPLPNLNCEGSINKNNVKPGEEITGSFIVENIGEPNSRLEWVVYEYPNWGNNWYFQPKAGRLKPEDGQFIVDVSFTSPEKSNKEFNGVIKVVAVGNPDDYYEIPITVQNPKNKDIQYVLNLLLERSPHLIPLLQRFIDYFQKI